MISSSHLNNFYPVTRNLKYTVRSLVMVRELVASAWGVKCPSLFPLIFRTVSNRLSHSTIPHRETCRMTLARYKASDT